MAAEEEVATDLAIDEFGFIVTKKEAETAIKARSDEQYVQKWLKMIATFDRYKKRKEGKLKKRVRKGIPPRLRGCVWQQLTTSRDFQAAHGTTYQDYRDKGITQELEDVIERDLARTFPNHCYFKENGSLGQLALRNVLHAYAAFNSQVGYCQGMGFVTATLIMHMAEEEAFWVLMQLMRTYGMAKMYAPGFPLLQEKFYQLRALLKTHLPHLQSHLEMEGVDLSFFASEWFLTLFVYQFPAALLLRVWDMFLNEGWKVIFKVAIALMKWEERRLLGLHFEELLPALKSLHENKNVDMVVRKSLQIKIRRQDLLTLATEYNATLKGK